MAAPVRTELDLPERGIALSMLDFGGHGSPVLLSHANGFCAALWEPIAERLATAHRVFAYDARGHGESSKPAPPEPYRWSEFAADLLAVSERVAERCGDAARPRPLYVIGHSFGGTAAVAAAARRPELFARLGLLDPVFPPPVVSSERRGQAAAAAQRRRQSFASRDEVRARYGGREPFSSWHPRVFELYVQHGFESRPDGSVALRCPGEIEGAVYRMNDLDAAADAEKLRTPGLILFAARGSLPRELAERVASRAPGLRIENVAAGHLFPMEMPERAAQRLLRFARED